MKNSVTSDQTSDCRGKHAAGPSCTSVSTNASRDEVSHTPLQSAKSNHSGRSSRQNSQGSRKQKKRATKLNEIHNGFKQYCATEQYKSLLADYDYGRLPRSKFNTTFRKIRLDVDPKAYFVCVTCGRDNGSLCHCDSRRSSVVSEDPGIIAVQDIPPPAPEIRGPEPPVDTGDKEQQSPKRHVPSNATGDVIHNAIWWNRIVFNKSPSKFQPDVLINHTIGRLPEYTSRACAEQKTVIPDNWACDELYKYLIVHKFNYYPSLLISQDHMHKMAVKWLKENKISPEDFTPSQLHTFNATIGKAVSEKDSNYLRTPQSTEYERKQRFTKAWLRTGLPLTRTQSPRTTESANLGSPGATAKRPTPLTHWVKYFMTPRGTPEPGMGRRNFW